MTSNNSLSFRNDKVKIPLLIMQTWKNRRVPSHWRDSPVDIKKYMPHWEYVLMTDEDNENFCREYFPDFLPYFLSFPYNIQRADAIRYMWLYVHGGVYIDLDLVPTRNWDDLFYEDIELYLVSSGNVQSCITNSFMASKPGAQLWLDMIEHMKQDAPWWAGGKHMTVMNTTGPVSLNYMVKNSHFIFNSIDDNSPYKYKILPTELVMPCSVCDIETCHIGKAYLRPLQGSSWANWDTTFINFLLCKWNYILIAAIIVIIIIIIIYIIWYYANKRKK